MKKVVITGAADGIGKATAIACVEAGFFVIAADKDRLGLQHLQKILPFHRLETHLADFSCASVYQSFIGALYDKFNHRTLHALVNNPGLYHGKSVYEYRDGEMEKDWAISLKSLVSLSRDFARRERSSASLNESGRALRSIVNLTSVVAEPASMDALYAAAKAGVIGTTKANAWNFAPYVRVNAVAPGLVRNISVDDRIPDCRGAEYARQEIPREPITPDGIADVVMFLLSDQSRHLNGRVIAVDNGACPR
jgi:3-oxoacyl-[acyl-carrier protein] reductase